MANTNEIYRETVGLADPIDPSQQAQEELKKQAEQDYWARWCQEEPTQRLLTELVKSNTQIFAAISTAALNMPTLQDSIIRARLIESATIVKVLRAFQTGRYQLD